MVNIIQGSNTIETPTLSSALMDVLEGYINEHDLDINDDQELVFEDDLNPGCRRIIGVKDGKLYARAEQDDLHLVVEYCRELRDNEMDYRKRMNAGVKGKWIMPWIVEQELLARGWPLVEMTKNNDHSDLDRYFEYEAPEFKTTHGTLTTLPKMQMFS